MSYCHKDDTEMINADFWTKYLGRLFPKTKVENFFEDGEELKFGEMTVSHHRLQVSMNGAIHDVSSHSVGRMLMRF